MLRHLIALILLGLSLISHADVTIGQAAPAFTLPDQSGQPQSSERFRGKWLVLFFYPKADSPSCTAEACGFRDEIVVLRALGAEVVGISTDSVASIRKFADKYTLPYTLLADTDSRVSARFGALLDLGIIQFSRRHTFLIDPDGRLIKRYTDVDSANHAKTLITDLRKYQGKN